MVKNVKEIKEEINTGDIQTPNDYRIAVNLSQILLYPLTGRTFLCTCCGLHFEHKTTGREGVTSKLKG